MTNEPNPSPRSARAKWWRRASYLALALLAFYLVLRFTRDQIAVQGATELGAEDDPEAWHFKYGSIGSEGFSPPYWIWKALPVAFPEYLPAGYGEGYERLGFIFESTEAMIPIGFSQRRMRGYDAIGLNCAVCHVSTVRRDEFAKQQIVLGMPANRLDLEGYMRFLTRCALDDRFEPDFLLPVIEEVATSFDFLDRWFHRLVLIGETRRAILRLRHRVEALIDDPEVPEWGRGRVDTFAPYKALQFNYPMAELLPLARTGASDYPAIWNQKLREDAHLPAHWDGNNSSVFERNLSAALGTGVTPTTIDVPAIRRLGSWIRELPPPPFPWPERLQAGVIASGKTIYQAACAACHDTRGDFTGDPENWQLGTVVPLEQIGTDRFRIDSYSWDLITNQGSLFAGYDELRFHRFHRTNGYANHPLDGIWARAPYLHNGSVPTLRDLLEPTARRPAKFYRGDDVYDIERGGFCDHRDAAQRGEQPATPGLSLYDTLVPGNFRTGHEYGVHLSEQQKQALVQYLLTL